MLQVQGDREAKTSNARIPIAIMYETPVSALVDGGNNVGYVAVYRGAEIAIAKAKHTGLAAVGVYNSYFSGRNAYYLERIVNSGLVGLHTASGAPHIVPPGATRLALGTNPIAFGFPSAEGPVIFDIGTASLMWGEVLLAAETGEALPPGVAFDADGNPTVDGRAAARGGVAAFGGHKGYGLAFAIQALGLLAGAAIPRSEVQDYGFLFLVVDPGALLPGNPFATQMSGLVKAIQATPRRPGAEEIRIPSQRAFHERERRRRHTRRQSRDRCPRGAMIPCRITQPPFCALLSGSRDPMSEPTHFDLVRIGGGFANHVLRCSTPAPTRAT
jgi:LDH2 family malate/lactate/ureidoglycolate dehydrogenase